MCCLYMRGSRKFCQRGSNFDSDFFKFEDERKDPNSTFRGPSLFHQQNAIYMTFLLACQWWPNIECWLCSFVIFQGIETSIAKKPCSSVIFQGGGLDPYPLPLDPRMMYLEDDFIFKSPYCAVASI